MPVGDITLVATTNTYLKKQALDSSQLHTSEKVARIAGQAINVMQIRATQGGHSLVELGYGQGSWWLWRDHWRGWPDDAAPVARFTMPLGRSNSLQRGSLTISEGDRVLIRANATSGVIGGQTAADFDRVGVGPIPPSANYQIDTQVFNAPNYPGIKGFVYDIYPRSLPNGRSLFAIHFDADGPGSAGCIVLTDWEQWGQFRSVIAALRDRGIMRLPLVVDYSDQGASVPKR